MVNKLRIGLLTTLNTNIGDDFIREGLIAVISSLSKGRAVEYVAINKHEPHTVYPVWHPIRWSYRRGFRPRRKFGPIRRNAERWLPPLGFSRFDSCDLTVQCGTPIIWNGCRESEWARLIWRDVLARLGRSRSAVLNLGGGTCYPCEALPETLAGNADQEFIRLMLDAVSVTTVRDSLARRLFASIGYDTPHLACPALLPGLAFTTPGTPTRKVVLNYMRGGGHYDWGQGIDCDAWETAMRVTVERLQQEGWEPLFIAHNEEELRLAAKIWPALPRERPQSSQEYFALVRDAAFGVFNRLHASVAVAGLGIPSVAVGTDSRNLMVEALGLPVFYVKEAGPDRLLAAVQNLIRDRESESRRLLDLRESTFRGYQSVLRPFLERGGTGRK